jgi:hypothetical protein
MLADDALGLTPQQVDAVLEPVLRVLLLQLLDAALVLQLLLEAPQKLLESWVRLSCLAQLRFWHPARVYVRGAFWLYKKFLWVIFSPPTLLCRWRRWSLGVIARAQYLAVVGRRCLHASYVVGAYAHTSLVS